MADLYIDGRWTTPHEGGRRQIRCPADGSLVAEVDEATRPDTVRAIEVARRAFDDGEWQAADPRVHGELLSTVANLLRRDKAGLARTESLDTGKRLRESEIDVDDVIGVFDHYATLATEDPTRPVETGDPGRTSSIQYDPIGVCGLITPWNYPLLQASWKVAPALAAGNTFVLKSSELTPSTAIRLVALLEEAGLPAGVANLVLGAGPEAGTTRVRRRWQRDVGSVHADGSAAAGRGLVERVIACDVVAGKETFVKEELGIPRFTTDYREVVESDDVDAVLVLTSMAEHGPIAKAALEAGKHVLVEKPMAITLDAARELVALAARSPGYLLCAPAVVLSSTYQAIWRHIRRGDIGPVHLARARYGWSGPWWGQWFYRSGGGPLFDLGVYNVASLTGLIGPAQRVTAMAGTAIPSRVVDGELMEVEVEDNFQITIDFGEARFGTATAGFSMQAYRSPAIELYGGTGTIQMMGDDWAPAGYELWQNSVGAWQIHGDACPHWQGTDGLRHLVECIQAGTPPIITPEHAFHTLEVMIRSIESAREGRTMPIESTFTPPVFDLGEDRQDAHLVHDPSS